MKIIPLSDGIFSVDKSKQFLRFDPTTDQLEDRPKGSVLLGINPFLVITDQDMVLLDTGLGFAVDGRPQLLASLEGRGIRPEEVTRIVLSHLHKDHTNGLGILLEDGSFQMHFLKALCYMQRRELSFALGKDGNPSYNMPALKALENHPQVVWLESDEGNITDQISYAVSAGHTPFHQVVWVREDDETAFFGSDELPQQSYIKRNFAYKNDFDGKQAMESRKQWITQAGYENWTLLFYHGIKTAVAKLNQ